MRPMEILGALTALIPTKRPTMLYGAPGIGKSDLVKQAAKSLQLQCVDLRAVLLDPVDLRGIPQITETGKARWCPPDFLPSDGEGVLFLDELPQAVPAVQAALLQLMLDRRCGEYVLPDGWSIVAAGNRQEDRAGAHRLITPLLNRLIHLDLEVSTDDWAVWAMNNGIGQEIRGFIRFKSDLLCKFDPASGERAWPTPRSWAFANQVMHVSSDENVQRSVLAGCIGQGAATEFLAYVKIKSQLPDIDAILAEPKTTSVPTDLAVCYAIVTALTDKAKEHKKDDKILTAVVQYGERLKVEFATVLIRDLAAVLGAKFLQLPAAQGWIKANRDVLVNK